MNFAVLEMIPSLAAQEIPTDLASIHALVGDEGLGVLLELVRVAEGDPGEGSACSRIR
jgi:hypothetical protein